MRVVGIGASAGGIEATRELLERVSHLDGGAIPAWIVVMHLDPTNPSTLASQLQTSTTMPVVQVTEPTALSTGHVYVIPPGHGLRLEGETLLLEPLPDRSVRAPIDRFFESLAEAKHGDSAVVVLSGMGNDGTEGAARIGHAGGLVLVQDPDVARFDGMPRSVVDSGTPITAGSVEELAEAVSRWARGEPMGNDDPDSVARILRCVLRDTSHDFSEYRRTSLIRRIHHRMAAIPIRDIPEYAAHIDADPAEARRLVDDLLINVTRFFRDEEAFEALATDVVASLVDAPDRSGTIRVWVPGCATGEEAYSIAILFLERMSKLANPPSLQVFGTDIDRSALDVARRGIYGREIEGQVTSERLARYFAPLDGGFQVAPVVHKACLFTEHDLMRDPPFSRLDLVSCRNVLIYLGAEAKDRVLQIFHYALVPNGFLFLGPAEGVSRDGPSFGPVGGHRSLFRKVGASTGHHAVFGLSGPPSYRFAERFTPRTVSEHARLVRQVERCLLEDIAPPAVAIDERHRVLFFVGQSNPYLGLPSGAPPTDDLLELAAKPLRHELAVALREATEQKIGVRRVVSFHDAASTTVEIIVHPLRVPSGTQAVYLVAFGGSLPPTQPLPAALPPGADAAIMLETELRETRNQLETIVGELGQSNDELKTANEELQSLNEEFQSANEELQTSHEELQSMNEELRALNHALAQKITALDRANADINNLFVSTDVGSIFLDRELAIHRFTPHATRLFRLLETDRGRPIADIATRFEGCDVIEASKSVLATLATFEAKVSCPEDGRWYIVRVHPYRTLENVVDGVALTFIDVTDLQHEIAERESVEEELRAVFDSDAAGNAEIALPTGTILRANDTFIRLARIARTDLTKTRLTELVAHEDRDVLERLLVDLASRGKPTSQLELRFGREHPISTWVQLAGAPVDAASVSSGRAVIVAIDVTSQHDLEAKLVQARKVEALGRLAGGIAHDFNNLVAVASGHLELIERDRERNKSIEGSVATIRQVLDRASELTRQLLAFGGRGRVSPRTIVLADLLLGTERMLRRVIPSDIIMTMNVANDLWGVLADPGQVEQMLLNLVLNARDAMERGGRIDIDAANEPLVESIRISDTSGKVGDYVRISVKDSGPGMDEATLRRCLDPYFTTKPLGKGTGLGLASVSGAAEQAGGLLRIESSLGMGTTASIFLPRSLEHVVTTPRTSGIDVRPTIGNETILLVEDELLLLNLNRDALESYGYRVLTATNGAEALDVVRAHPERIHLVVSDVRMPHVDGCELAERLPGVRANVPILLISGNPGEARVPARIPFLAKPFVPSELARRMREILDPPRSDIVARARASDSVTRGEDGPLAPNVRRTTSR